MHHNKDDTEVAHRNEVGQEVEGLVNGRFGIKAVALVVELVMQHGLQALLQGAGLLLQPYSFFMGLI